jgi:3-methyladenine DNA glycosylase/8-oxoguanine DNA glycosylase
MLSFSNTEKGTKMKNTIIDRGGAAMTANNDIREAWAIIDSAALLAASGSNQTAADMMRRAADYLEGSAERIRNMAHTLSSLPDM